ncbi:MULTISPECIES: amidohydrolase family protein [Mycolicibacterium]|uniref:Cytosine deaminase-like metal-dependent hydrolase n=1 Tax=Mycolicibacterium senegalense TaxID=1796 RepID=A0A378W7Y6_9MYCO|nr:MULTISPECIES: amidohydrolase family protein [Mycolicibacterium]MCV7336082.1 amidohydrolase family protein [Mycolicibacterium senegalense]MDR7287912.1 cytosine/adenosine deaminase-related metal-dependent hydrolase [Mycolicibacterium senegalense]QZA24915.1 amidohydrolase family protein [Mycolicibacterium senegalense]CDP86680.1 amidohydrolase [Mycolicibacterium farcinogenes]SUA28512.1 cytosine deaminase-like metal-dependent hydrolase [Mycolicibacterium senegalense]
MSSIQESELVAKLTASAEDPERQVLLTGAHIVTMGSSGVIQGDILLHGNIIQEIAPRLAAAVGDAAIRIDVAGSIIVPGLIDAHVHAWEGQLRGLAPEADLATYMNLTHEGLATLYRPEDMGIAERLSAAQAINAGTTTFIDNSHNSRTRDHSNAAIEALLDTGIRAVYAAGAAQAGTHDHQFPQDLLRLREEYFSGVQDRVALRMFDIAPSKESWAFAAHNCFDLCTEMGAWIPALEELVDAGMMREGHTYNHCAGLSPEIWKAIADSGAAVNLSPRSDSHFGVGAFAPALEPNRHGLQEGISSDNELSYGHDMFTEMRTLMTVQRGLSFAEECADAESVPSRYGPLDVLRAATVGGAINAGLADKVGTLEKGKKADLVVLKLDTVATRLWGSVVGTVVNYAGIADVDTVFIDGQVKKWAGRLVGIDYESLARAGEASREYLLESFGRSLGDARQGLR